MRDLRDPQKLGEFLLKNIRPNSTLSKTYDELDGGRQLATIPIYPQDESMATVTAREYRQELQERAETGDKYAASMLKGEGWDEPD